jgi:hypothetical protein
MVVLAAVLVVLLGLAAWVLYHLTRRPRGNIPPVVPGLPLLGSAVRFGQDPINLVLEARAKFGDVFTLKYVACVCARCRCLTRFL